jgi:chromosome segregation ATPase
MTQEWLAAYWQPLLIALVVGFVLAWLIIGLPARRRSGRYQASAEDFERQLNSANKTLAESRKKEQDLQTSVNTLKNDLAQTSSQVAALKQDAAVREEELTARTNDLAVRDADLAAKNDELDVRNSELTDLKFQFATLRTAVQQAQEAFTTQLEPLQIRVQTLSTENANLKANLEGISGDLAMSRADIQTMTQTLANKDTALTEAYARAVRLQRDLGEQQNQVISAQSEVAALRRQVGTLSTTNRDLDNRLADARGEVANELAVLTSTMLRAKDEQLAKANATVEGLYAQLNELKSAKPSSG